MHTNEVGPGAWLKMTQDKSRQDEPQVSGGSGSSLSMRQCSLPGVRQRVNVYSTVGWIGLLYSGCTSQGPTALGSSIGRCREGLIRRLQECIPLAFSPLDLIN